MAEEASRLDEYLPAMGGVAGLSVRVDEALQVATLRYFAPDGRFAEAVHEVMGLALPQTQQALTASDELRWWRRPTFRSRHQIAARRRRSGPAESAAAQAP